MKRLHLLRHAKSSWDDPNLADHDRPLAKRGERDAPRAARRLREHCAAPQLIVSSPAKRALCTARIVAGELGLSDDTVAVERALYLATPEAILAVAARTDDTVSSLLLVGHNPGLTELADRLLPELGLDNLPTAGLLVLDLDAERWTALERTRTTLIYYDYPKNPGAPLPGQWPVTGR